MRQEAFSCDAQLAIGVSTGDVLTTDEVARHMAAPAEFELHELDDRQPQGRRLPARLLELA